MPASAAARISGLPIEVGMDVAVFTRAGIERICRFACELAMSRPRRQLTIVTKSNAQRHGMVFWDDGLPRRDPRISGAHRRLDAGRCDDAAHGVQARHRSIRSWPPTCMPTSCPISQRRSPARSASARPANIDPSRKRPSMFEPIHGSAFDIIGKGVANPLGSFWTACMMLDHLGRAERRAAADGGDRSRHRTRRGAAVLISAARRPRPRSPTR